MNNNANENQRTGEKDGSVPVSTHPKIVPLFPLDETGSVAGNSASASSDSAAAFRPFTLKAAIELASPPSLVAAVMPVLVGGVSAVALSPMVSLIPSAHAIIVWLLMLIVAVLMQAAVNTLNDYEDFLAGTDTSETILDIHDASIVYNNIDPKSAQRFAFVLLGCAALAGLIVVALTGWPLLVVGVIAAAVVLLYSKGSAPISYLPLGEVVSGIVMGGFITGSTYFAMTHVFAPSVILMSVPPIVTIALIMLTNNTCDIGRDISAGRKTLPIMLGYGRSLRLAKFLAWGTLLFMVVWVAALDVIIWRSLTVLFVNAIFAGTAYFLLRTKLDRIAAGPYDLKNRGPMMGNITGFCRLVNLAWSVLLLVNWVLGDVINVA